MKTTQAQMARMVLRHARRVDHRTLSNRIKSLVIAAWVIRHDEAARMGNWSKYMEAEHTLHLTPMAWTHEAYNINKNGLTAV